MTDHSVTNRRQLVTPPDWRQRTRDAIAGLPAVGLSGLGSTNKRDSSAATHTAARARRRIRTSKTLEFWAAFVDNAGLGPGAIDYGILQPDRAMWIAASHIGQNPWRLNQSNGEPSNFADSNPSKASNLANVVSRLEGGLLAAPDRYGFPVDLADETRYIFFDHETWWWSYAAQVTIDGGSDFGLASDVYLQATGDLWAACHAEYKRLMPKAAGIGWYHVSRYPNWVQGKQTNYSWPDQAQSIIEDAPIHAEQDIIWGHFYPIGSVLAGQGNSVGQQSEADCRTWCKNTARVHAEIAAQYGKPWVAVVWDDYVGVSGLSVKQEDIEIIIEEAAQYMPCAVMFASGTNAGQAYLQAWIDDEIVPAIAATGYASVTGSGTGVGDWNP